MTPVITLNAPPIILPDVEVRTLQDASYNATVTSLKRIHDDLMILRLRLDSGRPDFSAGQYAVLGLGFWEPRAPGCQVESAEDVKVRNLVRRAYSISCPLLQPTGGDEWRLATANETDELEFYVTLVRSASDHAPALTPRLFALQEGDRLFCGDKITGKYTLPELPKESTVIFAGTGTGEAPHNAMTAQLLASGHEGPIVNACCVRLKQDLGYLETHRRLEAMFPNYRYVALTTREPENLDESRPDYVGKRYLQDLFSSETFESETGAVLDPENTHVFLCGNPAMIGAPTPGTDQEASGMVALLESKGFTVDRPRNPGNVHFEKYW